MNGAANRIIFASFIVQNVTGLTNHRNDSCHCISAESATPVKISTLPRAQKTDTLPDGLLP